MNFFSTWVRLFRQGGSLKAKVARGGIWLALGGTTENVARLVRNMILARLLAAEAFGLMAIVLAVQAAFESCTSIGIRQAVVQSSHGREKTYLNGAWWLSCLRSAVLYVLGYATAPWVARFYENEELVPLLRVAYLTLVFNGLVSPAAYVDTKDMKFRRWAFSFHGGSMVGIALTVGLAVVWRGAWALVIGLAAEAAMRCVLSHVLTPFKPGFRLDREHLRSLLRFSRGMAGLPILYFIFMRCDVFVLGKMIPATALGLYSMALSLARTPSQLLDSLLVQVGLPALSQMQNDNRRLNRAIHRMTGLIAGVGIPAVALAVFHGRELLTLVYGPEYGAVAVPFALVLARTVAMSVGVPVATVYFALGRPDLQRLFSLVRTGILVALIVPSVRRFGLVGAASVMLLAMLVGCIIQVDVLRRLTSLRVADYTRVFLPPLACSGVIPLEWFFVGRFLPPTGLLRVAAGGAACLLAYAAVVALWFTRQHAAQARPEPPAERPAGGVGGGP